MFDSSGEMTPPCGVPLSELDLGRVACRRERSGLVG
jgi:hypothetical protein